jgi:subfamily B ATP-binding cassette protein MsbA
VFAVQGVMNYVQVLLLTGTTERVVARAARGAVRAPRAAVAGFFTERRTGELTSRLSAT